MRARNRKLAWLGLAVAVFTAVGGSSICRAADAPGAERNDVAKSQPSPAEIKCACSSMECRPPMISV